MLIHWSGIYDSAFEHPERPPMDVIYDDEKFDKWLAEQQEDYEKKAMSNFKKKAKNSRHILPSAYDHEEVIEIKRPRPSANK